LTMLNTIPVKTNIECLEEGEEVILLVPRYPTVIGKIAGKLLKRSKHIRVKLDELGSGTWRLIDGTRNVKEIGKELVDTFGEDAEPLYPRLAEFLKILEKNSFVTLTEYCEV